MAERDSKRLLVEAKGGTSSKEGTKRYGLGFNSGQARDHVANAVYTALKLISIHKNSLIAIALPDDTAHRRLVEEVEPIMERLGIGAFWVDQNGGARVWGSAEIDAVER